MSSLLLPAEEHTPFAAPGTMIIAAAVTADSTYRLVRLSRLIARLGADGRVDRSDRLLAHARRTARSRHQG